MIILHARKEGSITHSFTLSNDDSMRKGKEEERSFSVIMNSALITVMASKKKLQQGEFSVGESCNAGKFSLMPLPPLIP